MRQDTYIFEGKSWLVVGAGWLGWPLAEALAAAGAQVTVTTRKQATMQSLQPRMRWMSLDLDAVEMPSLGSFDGLVLAFPPAAQAGTSLYASRIARLLQGASARQWVMISSTGVYPQQPRNYEEDAAVLPQHAVVLGEQALLQAQPKALILRAGGLAGHDRRIGRYFSNRLLPDPDQVVNLVHQADVIGAVVHLVQQQRTGKYNVVAPMHPTKREVYQRDLEALNLPLFHLPVQAEVQDARIISSEKLLQAGYEFVYPDPRIFY